MTDTKPAPGRDAGQPAKPAPSNLSDYNDPDAANAEHEETGTQAQDVAQDARNADGDICEDSVHGGKSDPAQLIPDDVPDLVDKMNEMLRSGRIDMDGFAGEDDMDDESNIDHEHDEDEE